MKILAFLFVTIVSGCGASSPAVNTSSSSATPSTYAHHQTFRYIGNKKQTFKVPEEVTQISVVAIGGEGGGSTVSHGGRVTAVLPVVSGEILYVRIGGNGTIAGGYNGGADGGAGYFGHNGQAFGGGGASDIREGGDTPADRVLVAGGGGGQGGSGGYGTGGTGGKGGDTIGGTGASGGGGGYDCNGSGGTGGTQSSGGSGGAGGDCEYRGSSGTNGALLLGGVGGGGRTSRSYSYGPAGGGGGGGFYGGGGGGAAAIFPLGSEGGAGGGGGGGSSFVEPTAKDVHMWHGWTKNDYGLMVIRW